VVVVRSPYCLHTETEWGHIAIAERGYAVLLQDTRGRLSSQGEFVPFEHERGDGAASVAWVRQQPWCDGRVAVYGPSYLGLTAWACVGGCGSGELQAAIPVIAQSRVRPALFQGSEAAAAPSGGEAGGGEASGAAAGGTAEGVEAGGGFSLELCVLWLYLVFTLLQPALMRSRLALCRTLYRDWRARRLERACLAAPLEQIDELLLGSKVGFVQEALVSPHADAPCWRTPSSLLCDLPALPPPTPVTALAATPPPPLPPSAATPTPSPTPTLTLTSPTPTPPARLFPPVHIYSCWHDVFMAQAIVDYVTLAPHQPACRLIVGAHDHWSCARPEHLGLILRVVLDCLETHLPPAHHTDHATAGAAAAGSLRRAGCPPLRGFHGEGGAARPDAECALPVQLCFLGSHRWVGYAAWPPPVTPATLYLAHSRQLTGEPPPPAAAATAPLRYSYVYHPAEPTPAAGGPSFNPLNSGAVDQRRIERRPDVLVFSTAPLPSHLRLVGHVSLRLRLSASARSVDILGRLCLVTRRGSVNLCEGIISLVARPGEASIGGAAGRQVTLELGPVAADFEPGSQLRLHVASAAHPRWARNLCGDPDIPWAERKSGAAACRVHIWADGSSALVLPSEV